MAEQVVVEGLRRTFRDVVALDGISLTIGRGQVEALLGPNGAGKTTLVRILTTLLRPDGGRAQVAGCDVVLDPTGVRRAIALSGQHPALDEDAPGSANLRMFGTLLGLRGARLQRRCDELTDAFGLAEISGRHVRTYSGGERRRIDLAIALLGTPSVLFLDEPTAGLDPPGRRALWRTLKTMVDRGLTVLLTTQYLDEADHLADHVTIIDKGRVVAADDPAALKAATGQTMLHLRFADPRAAMRADAALGERHAVSQHDADELAVPLQDASAVPGLLSVLYRSGVEPVEISVRGPTLDDAFLMLTGHAADPVTASAGGG